MTSKPSCIKPLASTFTPRSCPSRPVLASKTLIVIIAKLEAAFYLVKRAAIDRGAGAFYLAAHATGDHRRRNGGHPGRSPAEGSRPSRLHHLREGRPPRRHLAGEHLSRDRLRRPVPRLRLLVRLESRLEPPVLAGGRDSGLLLRHGRAFRAPAPRPLW